MTKETLMRIGMFSVVAAAVAVGGLVGCAMTTTPSRQPSAPAPSRQPSTTSPTSGPSGSRRLHFAVASDGHFGEPGTDDRANYADLVAALNAADSADPLAVVVLNGDLSHGGVTRANGARAALAGLTPRYLVTQGNHDELTEAEWRQVWGTPGDQVVTFGDRSLILANTSNAAGDYVCPNEEWLTGALAETAEQRDVFVFFHITAKKWTTHGIDCPTTRSLLAGAPNVRAVFNGHDHDQLGIKNDRLNYVFDGRFGGSWGPAERTYRDVVVTDGQLTTRLITVDGRELSRNVLTW